MIIITILWRYNEIYNLNVNDVSYDIYQEINNEACYTYLYFRKPEE